MGVEKKSAAEIQAWLVAQLADLLYVEPDEIDAQETFDSYGLASRDAVMLSGDLEDWLERRLSPTVVYEYPTIEALARYLAGEQEVQETTPQVAVSQDIARESIAIIGMGCRFPGAENVEAFWQLLRDGVDAITEVPAERWDADAFFDPEPGTPGKMYTRWGGFLERVDQFDLAFFGISPREAARMDPQQRLLLEVAWEALEDAGYAPTSLAGSDTGVFVGISNNDYSLLQLGDFERIEAYTGTGNAFSVAANRLSFLLDLRGPSLAVDTACSSSLVSLHMACQSLRWGEASLALAGGVNLILSPELHITFSHARMMSPTGRCKTFDADADGYVRGEGCGIVVLKRLSEAVRDGDRILAVIRGSAMNHDGRSNGLTAPNGLSQQAVIHQALKSAQVSPEQLGYVETHGTGTKLGDPIEVQSLGAVLRERSQDRPCVMGSVKTNIGHLEAAAGVAGLIKVVLALKHQEIPPHLHFKEINPYIPLDQMPLTVPTQRQPWPAGNGQRYAGVSSFGFGGTNAHVVLQEAPPRDVTEDDVVRPWHMLCLSARDDVALRELAGRFERHLAQHPDESLADVGFTANTGRAHFDPRLAVAAGTSEQMRERLASFVAGRELPGVHRGGPTGADRARIAFLFTGQGAQYPAMGRQLYETQPTFRQTLDKCAEILAPHLERPLLPLIFKPGNETALDETAYTQPALFALEYALAQLWASWGVVPDYVLGHSVGEYVAACVAGVFSLEDGLKLIATRGRLMGALPQDGEMAVVFAGLERTSAALAAFEGQVTVAAANGPSNTVISGEREPVRAAVAYLESKGVTVRALKVSHAFHSPLMEPILDEFERTAQEVSFQSPNIRFVSNLTGRLLPPGEVPDAGYWRRHVREAVQFHAGMQTLAEEGCTVFVEAGPHPSLLSMGRRCLPDHAAIWLPSLKREQEDWPVLLDSLGALYTSGVEVDWAGFDRDYARYKVQLPTYPFQRERCWIEPSTSGRRRVVVSYHAPEADAAVEGEQRPIEAEAQVEPLQEQLTPQVLLAADDERRQQLLEAHLRSQTARVLGLAPGRVDVQRPINYLGLDSIMAIELKNSIEKGLGVNLPIASLLQGPNVAQLTTQVLAQLTAAPASSETRLAATGVAAGEYPLSYGQRAMWFQHQVAPGSVFNPVYAVRVRSALDVPALRRAFQTLVDRHPMLRTTFVARQGEPVQWIHEHGELYFEREDASDWSPEELNERLAEEAHRVFDLEQGPLLRVYVFSLSPTEHVLMLAAHHIVVDLWSLAVLINELQILLSFPDGQAHLPTLELHYPDYARWQSEMLAGDQGEKLWQYWQGKLGSELPVLNLPTDRPRPAVQTHNGASQSLWLDKSLSRKLESLGERYGVTLYATLLAAFKVLLYRYSGQEDLIVGTPTTGRSRAELTDLVGYFVNPVALRSRLSADLAFSAFLGQVSQTVVEAIDHQDYPFALLVEKLQPRRDASRLPISQVMFILQRAHLLYDEGLSKLAVGMDGLRLDLAGLALESVAVEERMAPFDLTLMMAEADGGLAASMTYNTDLYDADTIARMLSQLRTLLEAVVAQPEAAVSTLPLLTPSELHQIQVAFNATRQDLPLDRCVHELFEAQVERTPNALAAVFASTSTEGGKHTQFTYRELNQRANQLARHLQKLGVGPEVLVGICVERSLDMAIGLLGILKAGGAYLPLDPAYPSQRLAFMLEDAQAPVLLTQAQLVDRLPIQQTNKQTHEPTNQPTLVCLDADWEHISQETDTNPSNGVTPENLAYVIYTSGSTGRPKGVLLAHKGLCNLVQAQTEAFGVTGDSRVLQFASFSFDASVSETFMALLKGATLYLAAQDTLASVADLGQLLNDLAITTVTLPPSVLSVLPAEEISTLRTVISAGEACSSEVAARWSPGRRFFNAYGPTEATIGPTLYPVQDPLDGMANVPIGQPIANTQIYLLDAHQQPVPVGVPGELHVGGVGLARGYLNRPALTAQKFVPSPGGETNGASGTRLYKTGDLARYRPDGNIEFLGRIDFQVKVRGFRIELGEIEAVLRQHQALQTAVVLAREDTPGDGETRLVAYVVPGGEAAPTVSELRSFLGEKLAEYMLPSAFVTLEALPLTPNGKVDRKALPAPTSERPELETAYVMPQNEVQRTIASIWQQVLGVDKVGIHDNFFDLGGHSLLVAKIHSQLQEAFQRQLAMVELFRYPTVSALAAYLSRESDEQASVQRGLERADKQKEAMKRQRQRMSAIASRQKAARRRD